MVGLDEELIDGEGYVVIQERWKELPGAIELEFAGVQRRELDFSEEVPGHPGLLMLNVKVTPNQLKVLRQFRPDRLAMAGSDGIVQELDITKWGMVRYSPGPRGHWAYDIWTRTLPGPDPVVKLRLIPTESGGDLSQCSLS